jgi:putative transposase
VVYGVIGASSGCGARRLLHLNVTAHPTAAAWTLQQVREALGYEDRCRYLIDDRDSIFAKSVDNSIERLELKVLKSSLRSPTANTICEQMIGTIRRECLDCLSPVSEAHLCGPLKDWRAYPSHAPRCRLRGYERPLVAAAP